LRQAATRFLETWGLKSGTENLTAKRHRARIQEPEFANHQKKNAKTCLVSKTSGWIAFSPSGARFSTPRRHDAKKLEKFPRQPFRGELQSAVW